jgi:hypothetical protein
MVISEERSTSAPAYSGSATEGMQLVSSNGAIMQAILPFPAAAHEPTVGLLG